MVDDGQMATPGDVSQRLSAKRQQEEENRRLKAARRAEAERHAAAKAEKQRRLALPPQERLAAASARVDQKWTLPPVAVPAAEILAAQRATMTRVEIVEVVREVIREITVEVPAPPLAAGTYTECEVCVGRGMRDRYGQVPAAAHRMILRDPAGEQVAAVETCPTHVPYVETTARRRGFTAQARDTPSGAV